MNYEQYQLVDHLLIPLIPSILFDYYTTSHHIPLLLSLFSPNLSLFSLFPFISFSPSIFSPLLVFSFLFSLSFPPFIMALLPRRLWRHLTIVLALGLLLALSYLYHDAVIPQIIGFFNPATADVYVVDIAIGDCSKLKSALKWCAVPPASHGHGGNLREIGAGGWVRINKDLGLGKGWVKQQYLSVKTITHVAENESKDPLPVIVDIAVSHADDASIAGNEKTRFPSAIVDEYNAKKVFGDDDHARILSTLGGVDVINTDSLKAASSKINDFKKEKEKEKGKEEEKKKEEKKKEENNENNENKEEKKEKREDLKERDIIDDIKERDIELSSPSHTLNSRSLETSRHDLDRQMYIPTAAEVESMGWTKKSHGLWVKYGPHTASEAVTGVNVLFGNHAVDPRPNWKLLGRPLQGTMAKSSEAPHLTFRRGPRVDYLREYESRLKFGLDGKFKILQVSDLHFATGVGKCRDPVPADISGCEADPRTLQYLDLVLETEKPNLVVLTGDQNFGDVSPDPQTAIFKALNPFIVRQIPFAVTLGNHDDETSMSRNDTLSISINLPYSMTERGPDDIDGVGNYVLNVEAPDSNDKAFTMYFLDSHSYTQNRKVSGNWDWIKENQLKWVERQYGALRKLIGSYKHKYMSMAFFHIPLPEYHNTHQPHVGLRKEPPAGPRYNSGARTVLGNAGVVVTSVGHDHLNDYCLKDTQKLHDVENKMWLCYGGGAGEGGYGGKDYVRRVRVYEIDTLQGSIKSWKRAQNSPEVVFDEHEMVRDGKVNDELPQ